MTYVPPSDEVEAAERAGHERMNWYVEAVRALVEVGEASPLGERAYLAGLMAAASDALHLSAYGREMGA